MTELARPSMSLAPPPSPHCIVVMGVSGSGKSTVGSLLAGRLGWHFHEGDEYHPTANVEKMSTGIPLTDADRAPWLAALRRLIESALARDESLVLACSALKEAYRAVLRVDERVRFVYLRGSPELLAARTQARTEHFMPPSLLASQLATLEEPDDAIVVEVADPPESVVEHILEALAASVPGINHAARPQRRTSGH